jgi:predicted GTPase
MKEVRTQLILAAKEKKKKQDMEKKMLGVKKKLSLKQLSNIANWDLNDESQNIDPVKTDKKRMETSTPFALRKNIAAGDSSGQDKVLEVIQRIARLPKRKQLLKIL